MEKVPDSTWFLFGGSFGFPVDFTVELRYILSMEICCWRFKKGNT
ncbi:hypothetical protein HMPREF9374_2364 [Desmospora sp. 8437]|nr:hypothetical protein HMPREF9374_2364 [Desmospora sp. 8437]